MSAGIGAYRLSISMVATARSLLGPEFARSIDFTLPTETFEIRTSDSTASCVASSKGTLTR